MMIFISNIPFYFLLFSISFISILFIRCNAKKRSKSKTPRIQHPPSPPSLPLIGHLHLLSPALSKSFHYLSTRYGPLMRLRFGSASTIVVSNATIAKEMLKNNEMNFVSRPHFGSSDYDIYDGCTFIFAEYGVYWRFMKKLCMTELLSMAQLNRFSDIRMQEMKKLIETLLKCSQEGNNKGCNLGLELLRMTNNVVCRMAMSTRCSERVDESKLVWEFVKGVEVLALKFSLGELLGPVNKLDLFGYGRRLKALLLGFDAMVEKIMVEHEKDIDTGKEKKKDIMGILLEIYRDEQAEVKLTRKNIKSFLMELFMAGTETTSAALQWTIAELINHPKVFNKLREEINGVVGTRLVEESDVPNLPYLQAVVKESLRLHPTAALIFRKCVKDCKINGYDILANERTIFNLTAIMRDPNLWENPLDFIPERFTTNLQENHDPYKIDFKGQDFKIFPFGSGRRGCPGTSFALTVIHGVVATLVQCFDFEVEGGGKLNMEERAGFSNGMVHPLICYPITHFNPFHC
ncbi:hypothetical protein ACH5RR_002702 [Cinchona calisaya]|uniref:Cytochrome P450 n=1 Tax=Cinchona calisaya TaxID=153742 RepID=A0ABD3ASR0_9GENT